MKSKIIILVMFFCLLSLVVFAIILTGAFSIFIKSPELPKIKYGEFPFSIIYEVNGDVKIYEDVIICEYAGIKSYGTAGKYRQWTKRLKSGKEYIELDSVTINDISYIVYESPPGLPEYYMADYRQSKESYERAMYDRSYLGLKWVDDGEQKYKTITAQEGYDMYGVRIINIECSQPIENSFGKDDEYVNLIKDD